MGLRAREPLPILFGWRKNCTWYPLSDYLAILDQGPIDITSFL